jgi:hypothetical protein
MTSSWRACSLDSASIDLVVSSSRNSRKKAPSGEKRNLRGDPHQGQFLAEPCLASDHGALPSRTLAGHHAP